MPAKFGVAKGEAVADQGNQTSQLDLIVYDRHDSAVLFRGKAGRLLIPAESVYAVIECKTTLTKDELKSSFKAAARLKAIRPYQKLGFRLRHTPMVSSQNGTIADTIKLYCFSLPDPASLCQTGQEKSP